MNKKGKKIAKKIKNNVLKSKTDTKIAQMKNNLNIENVISTKKLKIFLGFIIFVLILLILRLFYLQIFDGSHLSSLASKQQVINEEISSKRGNIYDTTGASLAISETVDTVSINPKKIKGKTDEDTKKLKEKIAKGLSEIFELDYNETLNKVNSNSSTETIIKKNR